MGKTIIKQIGIIRLLILFPCLFMLGGSRFEKIHRSVNIHSGEQVSRLIRESVPGHIKLNIPAPGIVPCGGTVSHHLLVAPVINAWFRELKTCRKGIGTFIIISPNHNRSGHGNISLSLYNWKSAGRITGVNRNITRSIMKSLDMKEDNLAFYNEHGIEAMLPFINHYYPDADIVPILVDEKRKCGTLNMKLGDSLCRIMKKHDDIFLLISTDFSHGTGRGKTDMNDMRSLKSITTLSFSPVRPVSDNTAGLMILYRVCETLGIKNTHLFCHTDAGKYTLMDQGNNITSYIFTYQY